MTPDHWDDLMSVEANLEHACVLTEVTTDMLIDFRLSPGAAPADRAVLNNLGSLMWILREQVTKLQVDLAAATSGLAKQRSEAIK